MRRLTVLLSLTLAAGASLATAPAAHADPFCSRVWTDGSVAGYFSTKQTCVDYQYGVDCLYDDTWYDPYVETHVLVCYPAIIPWP